jgi:hypothetical protein
MENVPGFHWDNYFFSDEDMPSEEYVRHVMTTIKEDEDAGIPSKKRINDVIDNVMENRSRNLRVLIYEIQREFQGISRLKRCKQSYTLIAKKSHE